MRLLLQASPSTATVLSIGLTKSNLDFEERILIPRGSFFCVCGRGSFFIKRRMGLFRKKVQRQEGEELKEILAYLKRQEESEIRLSVRAIVMFEALSGKKFSDAISDDEQLLTLMYCAFVCSTGMEIEKDIFLSMLGNEEFAAKMNKDMKRLQRFSEQFGKDNGDGGEEGSSGKTEVSITEMADRLVFAFGVDPQYVYEKLQLWELSHFLESAEKQFKERMEEQRMWSFLQVAPQIDLKKCKSPDKFLPFPWDKAEKDKKRQEELAKEAERAKATIGMTF